MYSNDVADILFSNNLLGFEEEIIKWVEVDISRGGCSSHKTCPLPKVKFKKIALAWDHICLKTESTMVPCSNQLHSPSVVFCIQQEVGAYNCYTHSDNSKNKEYK